MGQRDDLSELQRVQSTKLEAVLEVRPEIRRLMLIGRFRFNRATHRFAVQSSLGEFRVPGISEVLRIAGIVREQFYTRAGRSRGSLVHEWTEAADLGLADLERAQGPVRGWVLAYRKFLADEQPRTDLIEHPVLQRRYGYATVIDRAGRLRGPAIWNLKTGAPAQWHGIQRALEVLALDGRRSARKRFTVYLRESGRYGLVEHCNDADFDDGISALAEWRKTCASRPEWQPVIAATATAFARRKVA